MGLFGLRTQVARSWLTTYAAYTQWPFTALSPVSAHPFNWIISSSRCTNLYTKCRSTALEAGSQLKPRSVPPICVQPPSFNRNLADALHAHVQLLMMKLRKFSLKFVSWSQLASLPAQFRLICYNICSLWEQRGQLIETTLNLLILSQIKRRFIHTRIQMQRVQWTVAMRNYD